jgi:hypothetical protein
MIVSGLPCLMFDGLGWNTKMRKEKIEQKEAKETKGFRIRIFSKVIQWFSACPRDVRRALRSGRNQNRRQPLGAPLCYLLFNPSSNLL